MESRCVEGMIVTSGGRSAGDGFCLLKVRPVTTKRMQRTLPMILQWDEAFDVGSVTLTGVNDADYRPPFPLTARLNRLTIRVDRPQLSPEDVRRLEVEMQKAAMARQ